MKIIRVDSIRSALGEGFTDQVEMLSFFKKRYGLPFQEADLIKWDVEVIRQYILKTLAEEHRVKLIRLSLDRHKALVKYENGSRHWEYAANLLKFEEEDSTK